MPQFLKVGFLIAILVGLGAVLWTLWGTDPVHAEEVLISGGMATSPSKEIRPSSSQALPIRTEAAAKELRTSLIRGRAVDVNGNGIAIERVRVAEVYGEGVHSSSSSAAPGVEGVGDFEYSLKDLTSANQWFVDHGMADKAYRLQGLRFESRSESGWGSVGEIELQAPAQPQIVDVGDVVLTPLNAIANGVVVDHNGAPVAQAMISVELRLVGEGEQGSRLKLNRDRIVSDDDGRFSVPGEKQRLGEYWILSQCPGYETLEQPFRPFRDEIRLVMRRLPLVEGVILADANVGELLDLRLVTEAAFDPWAMQLGWNIGMEGVPFTSPVPCHAPFQIEVRLLGSDSLYLSPEYSAAPGKSLRPAELNPLDLRGTFITVGVKLIDEAGNCLDGTATLIDGNRTSVRTVPSNGTSLAALGPIPKLLLSADGFRPKLMHDVKEDVTAVMQAGLTVKVQISADLLHFRGGGFRLAMPSYPLDKDTNYSIPQTRFNADGIATVQFPEAGDYRLALTYDPPAESNLSQRDRTIARQTHAVHTEGQVIQLFVDPSELAKLGQ